MLQPFEGNTKKVLMIVRVFPPFNPVGHSIRAVKFTKYLPKLGWRPVILTIDDQKDYGTSRKGSSESLLSEIDPQVKIYRIAAGEQSLMYLEWEMKFSQRNWFTKLIVKIFGGGRRWVLRNIFLPDPFVAWLPFVLNAGRRIVNNEKIDVIFATCPPHSAILAGACLKLLTGKPLVLDFRDDWIDTPWFCSKPELSRWIERRMESWAVNMADKVILVTEWSMNAFLARYPTQPREKFFHISNGCDLEEFSVLNSMSVVSHRTKFTIVHAGSLNVSSVWGRSLTGLFQATQRILHEHPELKETFEIKFAGDLPQEFRKLADEMGLSDVIQGLGHLPHDEVLRLTKTANLLLAMNYEGWATLIPGKIYEYWAAGGPPILLLSCPGAAADFVAQHNIGFTADPNDVDEIKRLLLDVYNRSKSDSPILIKADGIEVYDRQILTQRLALLLSSIVQDS